MTNVIKPSKKVVIKAGLTGFVSSLFIAFYVFVQLFTADEQEAEVELTVEPYMIFIAVGIVLLICIISIIVSYSIYKSESMYIENNALVREKTFIVKRKTVIPLEKVNLVKTKQSPFDLMLGTAVLCVDSGNQKLNVGAEIKICLLKEDANKYSQFIKDCSKAVKENKEIPTETVEKTLLKDDPSVEYKLTTKDKLGYIFTNQGMIISLICTLIFIGIGILILNLHMPDFEQEMDMTQEAFAAIFVGLGISIIPIALIGVFIYSIIGLYNFTASKNDDGITIKYGLLNVKSEFVSFDKIHGYIKDTSLLGQIFGFSSLRLAVVGMGATANNNQNGITYLFPCAKSKRIDEIISNLLGDIKFDGEVHKQPRVSLVHNIVIPLIACFVILACITVPLAIFFSVYFLVGPYLFLLVIYLIDGFLSHKNTSIGVSEDFTYYSLGALLKSEIVLKTSSIQEVRTYQGFIRRKHKLCTYRIYFRGMSLGIRTAPRNLPSIDLEGLK